jgi:hypothetical protein
VNGEANATLGSKRTGALQHERPISWRSECPLPEQAASTLATTANVGNPPIVTNVADPIEVAFGLEAVHRIAEQVFDFAVR